VRSSSLPCRPRWQSERVRNQALGLCVSRALQWETLMNGSVCVFCRLRGALGDKLFGWAWVKMRKLIVGNVLIYIYIYIYINNYHVDGQERVSSLTARVVYQPYGIIKTENWQVVIMAIPSSHSSTLYLPREVPGYTQKLYAMDA
jgi:hypothetical protein